MDTIELASRLAGATWGHVVGDAVGVPYEFRAADRIGDVVFGATGTHGQPPGTWSDDGALMLALLDSMLESGFDPEDQGRRALAWWSDGAYTPDGDGRFDIGGATSRAMRALKAGVAAVDAGPADEHACGNGSLMRILPVALLGRDLPPAALIEQAHLASRVTHGHARCQVACAVYCLLVVGVLRGGAPADVLEGAFSAAAREYDDGDLAAHRAALTELRAWTGRSGRGFVTDSFWSAWDAFAEATDYADAIRRAVAYGNDTDTTAAIAGGLAGARWGWDGIPPAWRQRMRGREVATPLVDRLVATTGARTSSVSPLRVNSISLAGTSLDGGPGRLGITFLPGKKRTGWTGDHWRDLDADLAALRSISFDALFLLVEDFELEDWRVPDLAEAMASVGPALIRYPTPDGHVPADIASYRAAVADLVRRIAAGESIAIACRGGLDRSGMTAACVLREAGLDGNTSIARVQAARRGSITLPRQQEVVRAWRRS